MITRIRTAMTNQDGAAGVEYGILVAAIAALIVAIAFIIGPRVAGAFDEVAESLQTNNVPTYDGTAGN